MTTIVCPTPIRNLALETALEVLDHADQWEAKSRHDRANVAQQLMAARELLERDIDRLAWQPQAKREVKQLWNESKRIAMAIIRLGFNV